MLDPDRPPHGTAGAETGRDIPAGSERGRDTPARRADGLDAFRGFAILMMALSGMLHAYDLPAWMFHAQTPPPTHDFDPTIPGLTWVDLVFPFFLFSMGAAMPLAMVRRIERGVATWALAGYAVRRGVLLLAFALYVQHIVPWRFAVDGHVPAWRWWWALLAFALLFPALARLPRDWPAWRVWAARIVGWGGAVALLATPGGHGAVNAGFSWERADIILVVLAHVAVAGAILWLISRNNLPLRMGLILAVVLITLGAEAENWLRELWHKLSPNRALLLLGYCKYLLIVVPGTIAGDAILRWLQGTDEPLVEDAARRSAAWSGARHVVIAALMVAFCVFICCGLQARWLPGTDFVAFAAAAAGAALFVRPATARERLYRTLYGWGVLWLVCGLLVEPFEGGIRKDHATLSYYFVTSGLACFALIFFSVVADGLRRRAWLWLLIDNGQNPMIAYVGIRNLVPPILGLLGIEAWMGARLAGAGWAGFGWACAKTLLVALAVSGCTRVRVFWRT